MSDWIISRLHNQLIVSWFCQTDDLNANSRPKSSTTSESSHRSAVVHLFKSSVRRRSPSSCQCVYLSAVWLHVLIEKPSACKRTAMNEHFVNECQPITLMSLLIYGPATSGQRTRVRVYVWYYTYRLQILQQLCRFRPFPHVTGMTFLYTLLK